MYANITMVVGVVVSFSLVLGCCAGRDCKALPVSLVRVRRLVKSARVWRSLCAFFESDFKIYVDTETCGGVASPEALLKKHATKASFLDSRWSLDMSLPVAVAYSRWGTDRKALANATLAVFEARRQSRSALSACARKLDLGTWLTVSTDRGRCCDGGQLRDPFLLNFHLLTPAAEAKRGPFLFREKDARHLWRAPVTRNTSPRLRCFDDAMDISLPPPAFLRLKDESLEEEEGNRTLLVMHAEGGQGPPEYDLRRAVTTAWARDWWQGAAFENELLRLEEKNIKLAIRKQTTSTEHAELMAHAKFCLVIEGYAPWTPRLVEAIKNGCVPAILSPSYKPPFADLLDWSKFSVFLQPTDIRTLPQKLSAVDYAFLKRNLDLVKPLFSFCLPPLRCDNDALPLVVYQMAMRSRRRRRTTIEENSVLALTADDLTGDPRQVGHLRRTRVRFQCTQDGSACDYTFDEQAWRCTTQTDMACACERSKTSLR